MVNTRVAQVSNVSAAATMEQLRTLFGFLGKIEDIRLFPKEDSVLPVTVRICFVRFQDPTSVGMAQHLSNTVFLDKALNVTPFPDGVIPEESRALQMVAASAGGLVSMISNAGTSLLPTPPQPLLGHLPGTISGVAVSTTSAGVMDQTFAALGVPQPPPLTNVDPTKVEEIRRTVYVGNLDSGTVTAEQLLSFFQKVGEVKYVRMAGDETQPTRFAFVEFTEQGSVAKALTYNSVMFAGRPLKINHSNNAIVKPPGKTQEAIQKELAETMKQVRDAQALIQAAIDPGLVGDNEKKKRSKSRSPARRKSRSRSRRRSRSRSKDARRSRSRRSTSRTRRRSRSPRRRSPPPRRKSRSRSRHRRSRSKSKEHRSRSREKRRRSKTPPKSYRASRRSRSRSREKKEESSSKSRRRSRSPSKHRSRSKSRSGSPKRPSKHRKDKKRDRSKDRDRKEKEGRNSSSSSSSRKRKEKEQTEKEPVEAVEVKKEEKTDKADSKIKRDYDEEEKGFDSQEAAPVVKEEKEEEEEEEPEEEEEEEEVDIVKTEDMDVDSD
ncbi:uncharacterized protein [Apostichopus japonicus]|uniref:uncharacterized protein isoform X4 n=1 Tax=Stichopus japonicus TaxID=307972 RepID=UPI003AB68D16